MGNDPTRPARVFVKIPTQDVYFNSVDISQKNYKEMLGPAGDFSFSQG